MFIGVAALTPKPSGTKWYGAIAACWVKFGSSYIHIIRPDFNRRKVDSCFDRRHQVCGYMNLRDAATRADFCRGPRHFERIILSNEIDRRRWQILLDNFGGVNAVEIWHRDIEQNDVWIESECFLHGVLSVLRFPAYIPSFMGFQKQF